MAGPFFCYTVTMDIYELAGLMHSKMCHQGHEDYCDWYYRVNDEDRWTQKYSAHASYLERARYVYGATGLEIDDIAKVVKAL